MKIIQNTYGVQIIIKQCGDWTLLAEDCYKGLFYDYVVAFGHKDDGTRQCGIGFHNLDDALLCFKNKTSPTYMPKHMKKGD